MGRARDLRPGRVLLVVLTLSCFAAPALAQTPSRAEAAVETSAPPPTPAPAKRVRKKPRASRAQLRYAESVRRWHDVTDGAKAPSDDAGRPKLVLESINTRETLVIAATSDEGDFAPEDIERASALLRDPRTGDVHPIEPELLRRIYRVQRHFAAPSIRVVSSYRTPHRANPSHHGRGEAMDFIVPGVPDGRVAEFAKTLGPCGVGLYPRSGFVHLDVREQNHFWVDSSGPGQRARSATRSKKRAHKAQAAKTTIK